MSGVADQPQGAYAEIYEKAARDILQDLQLILHEPELDTRPVELEQYRHLDRRWYRAQSQALEAAGFRWLRDLDGSAIAAQGSPPPVIRVMLSADGATSAALYHVIPRSPGFLMKSLLFLMRKWQTAKIVELTTHLADDRVLVTLNQGELNAFEPPPNTSRRSLPVTDMAEACLRSHQADLAQAGATPRVFQGFEDLDAARRAQRDRRNAWRDQVGILPSELDRMLKPHGQHGEAIRPYLVRALKLRDLRG